MKVLIVEDDPEIVESISLAFQIRWPGAKLISTHLGMRGVELVESEAPDVVILDLRLPDTNGFEVLKQIRLFSATPVLILSVRGEEADIVKGLEWGADDYVVKPFRQLELLARVRAVVRRKMREEEEQPLVCGRLRFDPSARKLAYGEREVKITPIEAHIIRHLMENSGRVVTHSRLAEAVWGDDCPGIAESLKVHICRLRQKLEQDPSHPQLILTEPGVGYLLAKSS